jgi:ribosomal protein L20
MRYVMCRRKTVEKKMLKIWVSVLGMVQKQKDMSYPQLFFF